MHYNKKRYAVGKKVADNLTESWLCVDCGMNTAPGIADGPTTRREVALKGSVDNRIGDDTEIYAVWPKLWKKAGMHPWGGCLCIGCLEKRLGRRLTYKDFDPYNVLNEMSQGGRGTERLLDRRRNPKWEPPEKVRWEEK